jgi:hypothetical protein
MSHSPRIMNFQVSLCVATVLTMVSLVSVFAIRAHAQRERNPNPSNPLSNPGFETGDFTGWTVAGTSSNYGVNTEGYPIIGTDGTVVVHSGTYAGYALVDLTYDFLELSQVVSLDPGTYSVGLWAGNGSQSAFGDSIYISIDGRPIRLTSDPVIEPGYQFVGGTFLALNLNPVILFHLQGSGSGAAGLSFDDFSLTRVGVDPIRIAFPGETFTKTLGINNALMIAGYHGSGASGHPNQGFVLTFPNSFADENFPGSAQTQVAGINDATDTAGSYEDQNGIIHGFLDIGGSFSTVDFPGTTINRLLGLNDADEAAGYWQDESGAQFPYTYQNGTFTALDSSLPTHSSAQATGVNNAGAISGSYVDLNGVTHGFLSSGSTITTLDYPGATFTQALGLNNSGLVVGSYLDSAGATHGFVYSVSLQRFRSHDDRFGVGTTVTNGINDHGLSVGFLVDSHGNTYGYTNVGPTSVSFSAVPSK